MFLKHSCKKTVFSKTVYKFCPKSIKDEIMCQPASEMLHTSTHLQRKKKISHYTTRATTHTVK